jgi:hypothetical protein
MGHHALADVGFGRELRRLFPTVGEGKVRGDQGKRENSYTGLTRKPMDD